MSATFTFVSGAYLLLIRDGGILLQRRCHTDFMDGYYGVPSGHLEGEETPRAGCAREVKEEIGISIDPNDLRMVHVSHRMKPKSERFDFFFTVDRYEGDIANREPHKCDDLRWFPLNALPENTIDYVCAAINYYRNGIVYSEWNSRK